MSAKKRSLLLILAMILVFAAGLAAYRAFGGGAGASFVGASSSAEPSSGGQAADPSSEASGSGEDGAKTVAAPDCVLYDAQGEAVALKELLDGPAVINFWASTCPPCREEMPDFQAAYEQYGDRIRFIMIDGVGSMLNETQEAGAAYIAGQGFTFPVYFDNDRDAVSQYGIAAFPTTYLVDGEGMVIAGAQGMLSAESLEQGIQMLLEDE